MTGMVKEHTNVRFGVHRETPEPRFARPHSLS